MLGLLKKIYYAYRYRGIGFKGKNVVLEEGIKLTNRHNIHLGNNVRIGRFTKLMASSQHASIKIGNNTRIHDFCVLLAYDGYIEFGENCSLHEFSLIAGNGGVKIGNWVRIASGVKIYAAQHIFKERDIPIYKQGIEGKGVVIEDDVWIGTNAIVLDGVKIGKGSIIGAGAVVTRDIPPYSVAVGVPAKVIGKR